METFEIYFSDLTPEAQDRFLKAQGLQSAAEGNYDMDLVPLATFDFENQGEA